MVTSTMRSESTLTILGAKRVAESDSNRRDSPSEVPDRVIRRRILVQNGDTDADALGAHSESSRQSAVLQHEREATVHSISIRVDAKVLNARLTSILLRYMLFGSGLGESSVKTPRLPPHAEVRNHRNAASPRAHN